VAALFFKRSLLPAARSGRALTAMGALKRSPVPVSASLGYATHAVAVKFLPRYAEAFCWSHAQ
jgi:hypothetical protein